jgi:hypothetical protein
MLEFFETVFKTLTIRFFRKSGAISEQELELFPPKPQGDDQSIAIIADADVLYRRFRPDDFDSSGDLNPAAFQFPKPRDTEKSGQSFLVKGIAIVFHALHRNCNDGRPLPLGEWLVFQLPVAGIPKIIRDPDQRAFYFRPIHVPYSTCKAHCELLCSDRPDSLEYAVPGQKVKTTLRILLSRKFKHYWSAACGSAAQRIRGELTPLGLEPFG